MEMSKLLELYNEVSELDTVPKDQYYSYLVEGRLAKCTKTYNEELDDQIDNIISHLEDYDLHSILKLVKNLNKVISSSYSTFIDLYVQMIKTNYDK